MLVLESGAEDLVLPVGTLPENGRIGVPGVGVYKSEIHHIIVILGEWAEVHHIDAAGLPRESEHSVIREFRISGLSVLGRDENDTVSALRSVDSCRGSVLEDFHRDDIGRVDSGERRDRGDLTVT